MSNELDIWVGERLVARTISRDRASKIRIAYADEIHEQYGYETPLLSCSLPTPGPSTPANARAFLEGLLPEGRALTAAAAQVHGVRLVEGAPDKPRDVRTLLAEYGRECAGAVSVVPAGTQPRLVGRYEPLDDEALGQLITQLPERPLGTDLPRDIRMSLAGAQDKLLLARVDGRWCEPIDGAPSTHIIKPTTTWRHSAQNEALVLELGRACALLDNSSWVEQIGETSILAVQRYDRKVQHGRIVRIHQEDLCQATGLRPREKYAIGRPSFRMAKVLREFAASPRIEIAKLFRQIAFRVTVGDEDGHGKNYSLLLDEGRVTLAPLYDSLCTLIYPELSGKMGTPISTQESLAKVDAAALIEEARAMGLAHQEASETLDSLAADLTTAIASLRDDVTTGWPSEQVMEAISARIARLQSGEPLGRPLAKPAQRTPKSVRSTLDDATAARHTPSL